MNNSVLTAPFSSLLRRECKILKSNRWLQSLLFFAPVCLFILLWLIFSHGIVRDLSIGVVDLDNSKISRALIRNYNASSVVEVTNGYTNVLQGTRDLRSGKIYALVVIPRHMQKDTLLGFTPKVTAFYNNQFLLMGKIISSALLNAQETYAAQVGVLKNISKGGISTSVAVSQVLPIRNQITPLFNSNNDYAQFLVPAIISALWQILMVGITVLSIGEELYKEGIKNWLGKDPYRSLLAKFLPYTLFFWLQGIFFLWLLFAFFNWPMNGSFTILLFSQLLLVLACQGIGALFILITQDNARALSLAAGYTAPSFAFVGVTFPASDMNSLAQFWRGILPVSHYIEIQISQVNYGVINQAVFLKLAVLSLFLIPLYLAFVKVNKMAKDHIK